MDDEPVTISITIPPVLYGYLQSLMRLGRYVDESGCINWLLRREMFDTVGDPMELRGLVAKKTHPAADAAHQTSCDCCNT